MKRRIFRNGGISINGIPSDGGKVFGPITILLTPTQLQEAVSKQYIDNLNYAPNGVGSIKTGILNIARVISRYSGDFSANVTNQLVLPNIISATTATVLTVNAKGLVTGTTPLSNTHLPEFSWSKISTDKPTEASGYGITDGLTTGNNVVSGNIALSQHPNTNTEAASKGYVDTNSGSGSTGGVSVGDIVLKPTTTTPSGYLRCNGAAVSTTTYSALFTVIGVTGGANPPSGHFYLPNLLSKEGQRCSYFVKF